MHNPWVIRRRNSHDDVEEAVKRFVDNGGKITKLYDDNGSYDRNLKGLKKRMKGGFNPFSKTEALSKE